MNITVVPTFLRAETDYRRQQLTRDWQHGSREPRSTAARRRAQSRQVVAPVR